MSRSVRATAQAVALSVIMAAALAWCPVVARADLPVVPPGHVVGRVFDPALPGMQVDVYMLSGGVWSSVASATTEADGAFDIGGLAQGGQLYKVGVAPPSADWVQTFWAHTQVITDAPIGVTDIGAGSYLNADGGGWPVYLRLRGSDGLSGVARDSAGAPIANLLLSLWVNGSNGAFDHVGTATTAADGRYRFANLAPGSYRLFTWGLSDTYADGWYTDPASGLTSFNVLGQGTTNLDVQLFRGGVLTGAVHRSKDGAPMPGVGVYTWEGGQEYFGATDASGVWRITGLPTGRYVVRYVPADSAPEIGAYYPNAETPEDATLVDVSVESTTSVDTTLTTGGVVTGWCRDGLTGSVCSGSQDIYRLNPRTATWEHYTGNGKQYVDGRYVIGRLPTGTYRLRVAPWGGDMRPAFAPDATTLEAAADIFVTAGETVSVDTTAYPAEVIVGNAVSSLSGEPLFAIDVTLWSKNTTGGWEPVATMATNERGMPQPYQPGQHYWFEGIDPGVYRLTATDGSGEYADLGYPTGGSLAEAEDIVLSRGERAAFGLSLNPAHAWTRMASGTTAELRGVSFTDCAYGWVVGAGGTIRATTNGGASWVAQDSGTTEWLFAVDFADRAHGWAVGSTGVIVATTDGGATWKPQVSGTENELNSVVFDSSTHGWASGPSIALVTTDGGRTWKEQTPETARKGSVYGWTLGGLSNVLATTDGGATWTDQPLPGRSCYLTAFASCDASHAWGIGFYQGGSPAVIVGTTNGGSNWKMQTANTSEYLNSVECVDADHAWIVGTGGTILAYPRPYDDRPPVTTIRAVPTPNHTGWNNTSVAVGLTAADGAGGSGVAHSRLVVDGVLRLASGSYTLASDGSHTLQYSSVDVSGNVEPTRTAVVRIDKTPPKVASDVKGSYANSATIEASAKDALSGLARMEMWLDRGMPAATARVSTSEPGVHTLHVRAFDRAGSRAETSSSFTVWTNSVLTMPAVLGASRRNPWTTFSGRLTPARHAHLSLTIQKRSRGAWTIRKQRGLGTTSTGRWGYKIKLGTGTYRIRVSCPERPGYRAAASKWRTVKVK